MNLSCIGISLWIWVHFHSNAMILSGKENAGQIHDDVLRFSDKRMQLIRNCCKTVTTCNSQQFASKWAAEVLIFFFHRFSWIVDLLIKLWKESEAPFASDWRSILLISFYVSEVMLKLLETNDDTAQKLPRKIVVEQ